MLLDEIANFLASQALGTVGVDIFKGHLPSNPDDCTVIFETGGYPGSLAADIDYPTFQVLCRARDYETARAKAEQIYAQLHGLAETVLGTRRYLLIQASQAPASLGQDEAFRHEISTNYRVILENPTARR